MSAASRSLAGALFIRVALLLTVAIAVIGAIAFWSAKARIDAIYDAELVTGSELLHTLVKEELEEIAEQGGDAATSTLLEDEDVASFNVYAQWRMFRIWRGSRLVAKSAGGPANIVPPRGPGFSDVADKAGVWRVYSLQPRDVGVLIAVGEPVAQRAGVVQTFALSLVVPLLLVIPAALGLMWLTLLDGLGALRRLAGALQAKSGSDLAPLEVGQWPRDLSGMVTSINGLLGRVERSFRQTLRFTDHAAHQLRTPLAGLKLNAQILETETDPAQQRVVAARIREGAERGVALVEQLLTLAKLDSGTSQSSSNDIAAIGKAVLEDYAPVATANDVRLALNAGVRLVVQGDAVLLRMIVGNLVDNAIKHSPVGGEVALEAVREAAGLVRVTVMDNGPGIPADERERVFERFYRIDSDKPGVGLGLPIVAEALAQIGGSIALESQAGRQGLCAVVRLRAG